MSAIAIIIEKTIIKAHEIQPKIIMPRKSRGVRLLRMLYGTPIIIPLRS